LNASAMAAAAVRPARYWWSVKPETARERRAYHSWSRGLTNEACNHDVVAPANRVYGADPPPGYRPCKRCLRHQVEGGGE